MTQTQVPWWGQTERQLRELATWRLAAAVARAIPVTGLSETHPGGGQYDCVRLPLGVDAQGANPVSIEINRLGSAHLHHGPDLLSFPVLGDIGRGQGLDKAVSAIATATVERPHRSNSRLASTLERMHDLVELAVGRDARHHWRWVSGFDDSAYTAESAVRHELLAVLGDGAALRRGDVEHAQRLWALICDDEAVVVVDTGTHEVLHPPGPNGSSWAHAARAVRSHRPFPAAMTADRYAKSRRAPFADDAPALVAQVAGEGFHRLDHAVEGLTRRAEWFRRSGTLYAVVGAHEPPGSVLEVLAYGLTRGTSLGLELLLPPGPAARVVRLQPWLRPMTVHVHQSGQVEPAPVPTAQDVLTHASGWPVHTKDLHVLAPSIASWVAPLEAMATELYLDASHRSSYRSWHAEGRQVLRLSRSGGGVAVVAGVDYAKPTGAQSPALHLTLHGPPTAIEMAAIAERVEAAIEARSSGADGMHVEHRLQAGLAATGIPQIGLDIAPESQAAPARMEREFPAFRGDGARGYIDFLGVGNDGVLHVVETKVGPDPTVTLQALEYWVWVTANRSNIAPPLGAEAAGVVRLDLVLARDVNGQIADQHLQPALMALSPAVPRSVTEVKPMNGSQEPLPGTS